MLKESAECWRWRQVGGVRNEAGVLMESAECRNEAGVLKESAECWRLEVAAGSAEGGMRQACWRSRQGAGNGGEKAGRRMEE